MTRQGTIGANKKRGSYHRLQAKVDRSSITEKFTEGGGIHDNQKFERVCRIFLAVAVWLAPLGMASAAAPKEIVIGAVNSLSGLNVMTGAECKWAYEQAIADVNKKGGVFVKEFNKKVPVKLIFQDDKSTPDGGAEAMENLVKADKVDLVLSSNITPINIAAATIAEKYRVFYSMTFCWLEDAEKGTSSTPPTSFRARPRRRKPPSSSGSPGPKTRGRRGPPS